MSFEFKPASPEELANRGVLPEQPVKVEPVEDSAPELVTEKPTRKTKKVSS